MNDNSGLDLPVFSAASRIRSNAHSDALSVGFSAVLTHLLAAISLALRQLSEVAFHHLNDALVVQFASHSAHSHCSEDFLKRSICGDYLYHLLDIGLAAEAGVEGLQPF